jgi:hypothetical protein
MIWSQFPGVLSSWVNTSCSCLRMLMMRPAIVRISAFHSSKSSGLFRINATLMASVSKHCQLLLTALHAHHACTVRRRVRYLAPLQHRQLTADAARSLFVRMYDMERADPFTVQPGIFGKALRSAPFEDASAPKR